MKRTGRVLDKAWLCGIYDNAIGQFKYAGEKVCAGRCAALYDRGNEKKFFNKRKFFSGIIQTIMKEIKDFLKKLKDKKNVVPLKSKQQKIYQRMILDFEVGYYYEEYPEEKRKAEGTLISEAMGEPYIRSEKKIGRNDPCPCGLEKKYKHCCMKNKYSDVFILK